jgi:glycosyltransferase involved in cell wall biosynthesis
MSQPRILCILHLPPPVHGSSIVGQQIKDSPAIQSSFHSRFINLNTSLAVDKIGKAEFKKFGIYLGILWRVITALLTWRPSLAYVAITAKGPAFYKDALVVALIKLFRVPIVYHMHNKGVSTRKDKFPDRLVYRFVFRNAKVFLLSKYLYSDIAEFVAESEAFYCPNGISDSASESIISERNARSAVSTPTILFVGNLIESKGCLILLEACKLLRDRRIQFRCCFVGGEGDVSAEYLSERIADLNLHDQVKYLGKRFGDDKWQTFSDTDIFALPTFYNFEALPIVILEAMQWGLPVVSTPEGGIPDQVIDGETGFLVRQKDTIELADKLEELIRNPKMRMYMGHQGRQRYLQLFTSDHFESRLIEILKLCLVDRKC